MAVSKIQMSALLLCLLASSLAPQAEAIVFLRSVVNSLRSSIGSRGGGSPGPAVAAAATPTGALLPRLFSGGGGGIFGGGVPAALPGLTARAGQALGVSEGTEACTNDVSAAAVERCVNAVRTNPSAFAGVVPCGFDMTPRPPLRSDPALTNAANRHAGDMSAGGFVGHTGTDGSDLTSRVYGAGFGGGAIAENAAGGQGSARAVVFDWLCSPGHAANLLGCYDSFGTGVAGSSWVQNFGCASGACGC